MRQPLLIAAVLIATTGTAAAESRGGRCALPGLTMAFSTITALMASPGSISFQANDPNGGPVVGTSAATLNWTLLDGVEGQSWNVSVQANSGTLSGCSTVPVSAVTVSCASTSVGGGNGSGSCGGGFTLSTVAQQIANGTEGQGIQSYSVHLLYSLAESWRYVASAACSVMLTYTVNAL